MKRLLTCILGLFALFGLMLVPLNAENTEYVRDDYGLLSDSEVSRLNSLAASYSQAHDVGLYVRVYDDYTGYNTIEAFSESVYINERLDDDCLLLVITMYDRSFDIFASYEGKCDYAFGQYAREKIADKIVDDYLSAGDFYGGFKKFLDTADEYLILAEQGKPVINGNTDPDLKSGRRSMATAITLSIPEIIALFACLGMRSKMKTTGIASEARQYIRKNGIHLTQQDDIFLYRSQTRTKIHRDSDRGGGGGGFSSSSGSFGSHTSGHF